ncbi:ECF transporter S component [Candidatus Bathyarchaeota archaeon]|nr:ECF transporter S component [Candidatus Bathyarchaeota archaeon]MBS7612692.1 ECF transporter S component [Candidatus Bathyarchaeota archaeon]MBS7618200.1 ECF transporter S component [Candidatus Bathyarchaeota archaeon]
MRLSTKNVALTAVFAALYYVLSLITPFIPAVAIPEIKISLEALIASIYGLILGPYLGALAAFVGALVSWSLPPESMSPYGMPFLLSPPLNALLTGLIFYRRWRIGFSIYALLIIAFLFTPPVQPIHENFYVAVAVLWDKLIALLLILPCVKFAKRLSNLKSLPFFYFLLAFIGNQVDNMWGCLAFATPLVYGGIFGLPVETVRFLFIVSPLVYPAIRILQAIIASVIATPLMKAVAGTPWVFQEKNILSP